MGCGGVWWGVVGCREVWWGVDRVVGCGGVCVVWVGV